MYYDDIEGNQHKRRRRVEKQSKCRLKKRLPNRSCVCAVGAARRRATSCGKPHHRSTLAFLQNLDGLAIPKETKIIDFL